MKEKKGMNYLQNKRTFLFLSLKLEIGPQIYKQKIWCVRIFCLLQSWIDSD